MRGGVVGTRPNFPQETISPFQNLPRKVPLVVVYSDNPTEIQPIFPTPHNPPNLDVSSQTKSTDNCYIESGRRKRKEWTKTEKTQLLSGLRACRFEIDLDMIATYIPSRTMSQIRGHIK